MTDNCYFVTKKLLNILDVKYTNQYLEDVIFSHPYHPSILSICDTLEKYHIDNIVLKTSIDKLEKHPLPCIIQITDTDITLFTILKHISRDEVSYYDQTGKLINKSKTHFDQIWTGVCLLVEKNDNSIEPNYRKNSMTRRLFYRLFAFTSMFLFICIILQFNSSEVANKPTDLLLSLVYMFLKIAGLAIGFILLWFEVDQFNPTLQALCSKGGRKVNCNSILTSKYASVFNGAFSVGLLGFSYFFGSLVYLLYNGPSYLSLSLTSYLSFLSLPVVFISMYYQGIVIRQWCKLCLFIQLILICEIMTAFIGKFYTTPVTIASIPLLIFLFLLPILSWKFIKPLLEKQKEMTVYKRGLQKIKNNPEVLQSLISKTRKINTPTEGLGIIIPNPSAKYDIIKVCNPYCNPCAKAHSVLEELVKAGKINLQIIFTTRVEDERTSKPVKHLLAIDEKGNKKGTQQALDRWYNTENKDYEVFADNYPMNGELLKQDSKINAMSYWCEVEKITFTPTLFINGQELPREYSVEDLKDALQ